MKFSGRCNDLVHAVYALKKKYEYIHTVQCTSHAYFRVHFYVISRSVPLYKEISAVQEKIQFLLFLKLCLLFDLY